MGMDPKALPESILRLMAKADRAPLGKAGMTMTEAQGVKDQRDERTLQFNMRNLLNLAGIFYLTSRMDKKTTMPVGMPDFIIILPGGKCLAVEAKVAGGKVSPEQEEMFRKFERQTGQPVHVVWNLDEFRKLLPS